LVFELMRTTASTGIGIVRSGDVAPIARRDTCPSCSTPTTAPGTLAGIDVRGEGLGDQRSGHGSTFAARR
jgi:hypothetical protein